MLRRFHFRSIWNFYCVYNLCRAYLNYHEDKRYTRKRQKIWKSFIESSFLTGKFDEKRFKKMQEFMNNDMKVIINTLNKLDLSLEKIEDASGDLYRPGVIGILAYEFYSN